jgi:hypothetical protein
LNLCWISTKGCTIILRLRCIRGISWRARRMNEWITKITYDVQYCRLFYMLSVFGSIFFDLWHMHYRSKNMPYFLTCNACVSGTGWRGTSSPGARHTHITGQRICHQKPTTYKITCSIEHNM